jgi:hypothetical protein
MNKKGFELSVNFIVVVILAIFIMSMGLYLGYKSFALFELKKAQLDMETEAQIESMLASGEKVIVPIFRKPIEEGGTIFGLGVLNIVDNPSTEFKLEIIRCDRYTKDGSREQCAGGWTYDVTAQKFTLQKNGDRKLAVLIKIPNPESGTYAIKLKVCYNDPFGVDDPSQECPANQGFPDMYGTPQIIYVEVP